MSRRPVLTVMVVLALAGGAAACSDSGDDVSTADATTTSSVAATTATSVPPDTTTTTAVPAGCGEGAPGAAVETGDKTVEQLLTGVEVTAAGQCTDQVRFSFRANGSDPGVKVSYQSPPFTKDGSGAPVSVEGQAFLVVRFEPARTADMSVSPIQTTYDGPDTIQPTDTAFVEEMKQAGDFEAVLTWIIGLSEQRPFSVVTSSGDATVTIT